MIGFETWTMIKALHRQGWAKRKIAREVEVDRNTVRRVLRQDRPQPYARRPARPTLLTPYEAFIRQRVTEVDYCARRIFEDLQARGYRGSYDTVKLFVRPLRGERDRFEEATVRFETAPGRQAQVDWGSTWVWIDGTRVRMQLFVMVLGYSRRQYAEFTEDQTLETLIRCHEHAFDWFGGVTDEILYDNPKTIVLARDWEGKTITWNPRFWDFAKYYGFIPRLCRPGRARTKGKVESGIKYVKRAFGLGRHFATKAKLNPQLWEWLTTRADQRIHGTTFQKPAELFAHERLHPHHGKPPYQLPVVMPRTVAPDCLVTVDTNRYSVPWPYVGKAVEVVWGPEETVRIYHGGQLIACHPRRHERHQLVIDPVHTAALRRPVRPQAPSPAAPPQQGGPLWPRPADPVEVRDLAVYEALAQGGP